MDIQAAEARQVEDRLAKDLSKRGDDDKVRCPSRQFLRGVRIAQARRLEDRQTQAEGGYLDRRRGEGTAAAGGSIRLGDHANDLVDPGQGLKAGDGELGGAHEDEAHRAMVARSSGSPECNRAAPAGL